MTTASYPNGGQLYIKARGKYGGHTYYGVCIFGGNYRGLKGMRRTATDAIEYSQRVVERYMRMCADTSTGGVNANTSESTPDAASE